MVLIKKLNQTLFIDFSPCEFIFHQLRKIPKLILTHLSYQKWSFFTNRSDQIEPIVWMFDSDSRSFLFFSICPWSVSHSMCVCPGTRNLWSISSNSGTSWISNSNIAHKNEFLFCPGQESLYSIILVTFLGRFLRCSKRHDEISFPPRLTRASCHIMQCGQCAWLFSHQ